MAENGKEKFEKLPEALAPPEMEEPSVDETSPGKAKRTDRFKPYLQNIFRWGLGILIIFGLGAIATLIFVYQPTAKNLADVKDQLSEASGQVDTLQTRVNELEGVEEANGLLEEDLAAASLRVLLLSSLADVYAAQFAMETGDVANARVQLTNTHDTLVAMYDRLDPDQQPVVTGMQERLELALSEMSADPFAAQSDLEVLANSLISLENSYFASP